MLCFSYTRSASSYTNAGFQSIFSHFFVGLRRIFYVQMYLILNIDICSLLVKIDCVAMKRE